MIERERHIKELFDLRHINDNIKSGYDFENNLYSKMLSNVMFKNDTTNNFLMQIQKLSVWMIQSTLVVRNFFDYSVDKHYDKHNN